MEGSTTKSNSDRLVWAITVFPTQKHTLSYAIERYAKLAEVSIERSESMGYGILMLPC